MKIGVFLKTLPARMSTFIHREIALLQSEGHEVFLFPAWDIDQADLPETMRVPSNHIHRRFSLRHLGWIGAFGRFFITSPRTVMEIFSENRSVVGIAFILKSFEAARIVEREGIQRLYAHTLSVAATRARICHLLVGVPYGIVVHGSDLLLFPPADSILLLSDAAFIITPTEYNRKALIALASPMISGRISVIPNAVDTDYFHPRFGKKGDGRIVRLITVGRLHPVKGHHAMISAAAELKKRGLEITLTIVGDGELMSTLVREVSRLGLADTVTFAGALFDEQLRDMLSSSDIFVSASISEGLPVSVIEAMAVGLAVVAPRITGLPELVHHNETGLLFDPKDANGLIDALSRVVSDSKLRASLGRAARRIVEEQFSRKIVYRQFERAAGIHSS